MTATARETAPVQPAAAPAWWAETRATLVFFVKLVVLVLLFRSFVFAPFSIPSGSMLPRLLVGDYLFVAKWSYGYSRHSLPGSVPLIIGRVLARDPARGDVVVFKAPPLASEDYIKRVIGLPGDTVQMRGGQLILNGVAVPKERVADFVVAVSPNTHCVGRFADRDAVGRALCRYPRYRETLPGGRSYFVLDQGDMPADETRVYTVPDGAAFLMGDNRDDSLDSRFPAVAHGGIGFVPLANIEGKAVVGFWSTDGSARRWNPVSWFTATRFDRIGEGF